MQESRGKGNGNHELFVLKPGYKGLQGGKNPGAVVSESSTVNTKLVRCLRGCRTKEKKKGKEGKNP